jgi:hypothetical protein
MNTNAKRLRELIESAGLTQEQALDLFNNSRPKLFHPYSFSTWKGYFADPSTTRFRPFSEKNLERAETIFQKLGKKA